MPNMSQVDSSAEVVNHVDVFALEAVVKALEARTLKLETIIQVTVLHFPIYFQVIFF